MPLGWAFRSWVREEGTTISTQSLAHVELVATAVEHAGMAAVPCVDIEHSHCEAIAQVAGGVLASGEVHEIVRTVATYGAPRLVIDSRTGHGDAAASAVAATDEVVLDLREPSGDSTHHEPSVDRAERSASFLSEINAVSALDPGPGSSGVTRR